MEILSPLSLFLLQIIIIVVFARFIGIVFRRIGQPSVIGEILAGIFLGPSLFGAVFPEAFHFLFRDDSLHFLYMISEIGIIFYLFIIGMELDFDLVKKNSGISFWISHTGILIPFLSGMALAWYLHGTPLVSPDVPFLFFSLFMGISMSVTAFPVLARILQEKNLSRTPLGSIVLTCAAFNDVAAWSILAVIIALMRAGQIASVYITLGSAALYIFAMFFAVRPVLAKVGRIYITKESLTKEVVAGVFVLLFTSSLLTELIGIHALFGAFVAGAVMPQDHPLKSMISEKIEDISLVIFLPLFFALTGLRTDIGLLNNFSLWGTALLIVLIATFGKFIGSALPAVIKGMPLKDSLSVGILMNTRGLMEIVVLNIGYEAGILSSEIFVMFVMMAITTTVITGPALTLIKKISARSAAVTPVKRKASLLISFAKPRTALRLISLSKSLFGADEETDIRCIHISRNDIMTEKNAVRRIEKQFYILKKDAQKAGMNIHTSYRFTDNVAGEISRYAEKMHADLLLIGGSSVMQANPLGGKIKRIVRRSSVHTGIFVEGKKNVFEKCLLLKKKNKENKIEGLLESFRGRGNGIERLILDEIKQNSQKDAKPFDIKALILDPEKSPDLILMRVKLWNELKLYEYPDCIPSFLLFEMR